MTLNNDVYQDILLLLFVANQRPFPVSTVLPEQIKFRNRQSREVRQDDLNPALTGSVGSMKLVNAKTHRRTTSLYTNQAASNLLD